MTKQDNINYVQTCISNAWSCKENPFSKTENVIISTEQTFFEIATFGNNAAIRASAEMAKWCEEKFSDTPAKDIMDGENLFAIEKNYVNTAKSWLVSILTFSIFTLKLLFQNQGAFHLKYTKKTELLNYM